MHHQHFQIAKLAVIDAEPSPAGNRLLATFDMQIAGMRIGGCVLVERADGRVIAHGPQGKTKSGHKAHVSVQDERLRKAITERASVLYEGFTGRTLPAYRTKAEIEEA
ncbi:hypothetical protein [Tranquillimonas alkanivorans]|uniref:Uncharacterized protein n=1 Tax=Tranquillimonas alkanivorans TaxID=441119 RepID=A0A1I5RX53_9RHOB|nr:hypothetical protein [Tranquillimonas alkanivorans]SFP62967.1 hypothetical protein SAMN04488047_109132 [Tranquillimonas alkanivorans]